MPISGELMDDGQPPSGASVNAADGVAATNETRISGSRRSFSGIETGVR